MVLRMSVNRPAGRAIVVDGDKSIVALVRPLLLSARNFSVFSATDARSAWALLEQSEPNLILVAHAPPVLDAPQFTRDLRRGDLPARKAPVVMLADQPTAVEIKAARDAGVYEVLRKPFTIKDLILRVDAALDSKRDWIEGIAYVGPDRRRFNSAEYPGQLKRRVDRDPLSPEKARIGQALKIMKAAIEAIDAEPNQALRALRAQADELQDAAVAVTDLALAGAARTLRGHLDRVADAGRFNSRQFASDIDGLFGLTPRPEPAKKDVLWVE